jgi:transposase
MARLNRRDDQWERLAHRLPGKPREHGRTAADKRVFVEAVWWMTRSGAPRRDLPETFGPWNSVYKRFARRQERGVRQRICDALAGDADLEEVCIDRTVVRVHRHAAGAPNKRGSGRSVARAPTVPSSATSTAISIRDATWSNASFVASNRFAESPRDTTRRTGATRHSSPSLPLGFGSPNVNSTELWGAPSRALQWRSTPRTAKLRIGSSAAT